MTMDVDIDLEYSDRISDFLRSKLHEIKSQNTQLQAALDRRRETSSQLRRQLSEITTAASVSVGAVWKKTANCKYVLGVEINNDSANVLDNFTATLSWNSPSPLIYRTYVLPNTPTNPLNFSSQIVHSGHIILTFDIPLFTDQLSYTITASFAFHHNDKKMHLKLPTPIQLRPQDVTDNTNIVHFYKVIDGTIDDLQALALSSQKQEFVMVHLERLGRSIDSVFEAECGLRRINVKTQRKYFLVFKICPILDGVLLEVEDKGGEEVELKTYCKNADITVALLHYLHTHIIGVIIVPKVLYQPDLSLGELTDLARGSLLKEIELLEQSTGDLRQVRRKVSSLEHQTDLLVARIKEKRSS